MAWEWVAPVATAVAGASGAAFTWLAGRQGREHMERLAARSEKAAGEARLWQERRDAYFSLLRYVRIERKRAKYKHTSDAKLAELEKKWPKGERVSTEATVVTAIGMFGSLEARRILDDWLAKEGEERDEHLARFYQAFEQQVRRECGVDP
ncbi:hypothetical protein [Actinoplanes sp. RD1]|uniref:hypothetical protein n=1 Tax=Actinoplanes sp. RD1 TaxID=3064538 RepID=UPI0027406605|nr:hypothetical protein [Actinoplanes sp. RD1]